MAKLDQKFKKRTGHKFDDDEIDFLACERQKQKKMRRETRQRNPDYGVDA